MEDVTGLVRGMVVNPLLCHEMDVLAVPLTDRQRVLCFRHIRLCFF